MITLCREILELGSVLTSGKGTRGFTFGSKSKKRRIVLNENMSRKDAVALAARSLSASAQRDAASGNGMDLAVITAKDGYVPVDQSEIAAALKR